MSGKRHVLISTCGFYTAEGNYGGVCDLFDHLCGAGNYTAIFCGQGELFRVKELHQRTDEYLALVTRAGREFASGDISRETRRSLAQLLFPRETFEAMADASWGIETNGECADESLTFTRQMAALYNKSAFSGKEKVLEMVYTDIGKSYQIVLGREESTVLPEPTQVATTTIETTFLLWKQIAAGEISGEQALMEQKYRVKGDFDLMIHWDQFFGTPAPERNTSQLEQPSNMLLLLLPWMMFWISAASMEPLWAGLLCICVCSLLPLIFRKNRVLVFDQISSAASTLCSVLLLLNVDLAMVLPLSYFGFGLLWTLCGFGKVPLTAHYSVNDYGSNMMNNPLFIKTNRILTLCWGGLYLCMTIWTYILLRMGVSWVSAANSILPLVMGIFTAWFQKWYPAHIAQGNN